MLETLAVKYRPNKFEDVVSQNSIIQILTRQLELNEIRNCYLFTGSSGCGKTTLARIFANKINKGLGSPIEIDAASNTGVDNVRNIIQDAQARAIDAEYKIFIMDECHMLTTSAWNALLKCIEEPPKYTIFMFCTTDPQKIPVTILNRVMRFNINRIPVELICQRLEFICKSEGFEDYSESIDYISKISDGSLRTAISLLDKVASYNPKFSMNTTLLALGDYSPRTLLTLLWYIYKKDEKNALSIVNHLYESGIDLKLFVDQFLNFVLDVVKYAIFRDFKMTKFPQSLEEAIKNNFMFEDCLNVYNKYLDKLLELKNLIKFDSSPKSNIEVVILQMMRG